MATDKSFIEWKRNTFNKTTASNSSMSDDEFHVYPHVAVMEEKTPERFDSPLAQHFGTMSLQRVGLRTPQHFGTPTGKRLGFITPERFSSPTPERFGSASQEGSGSATSKRFSSPTPSLATIKSIDSKIGYAGKQILCEECLKDKPAADIMSLPQLVQLLPGNESPFRPIRLDDTPTGEKTLSCAKCQEPIESPTPKNCTPDLMAKFPKYDQEDNFDGNNENNMANDGEEDILNKTPSKLQKIGNFIYNKVTDIFGNRYVANITNGLKHIYKKYIILDSQSYNCCTISPRQPIRHKEGILGVISRIRESVSPLMRKLMFQSVDDAPFFIFLILAAPLQILLALLSLVLLIIYFIISSFRYVFNLVWFN